MKATEIVPGELYRLGGVVPIDGRLSWRAPGVTGHEPIGCYLLLEPGRALLAGTGVRLHERLVLDQLRALLDGRELEIYADRNEADQIGNLAAVVAEFGVRRIWFAGAGHLLRWFEYDGFGGNVPTGTEMVFMVPPGANRAIDLESERPSTVGFGGGRLELLHTRLTTLGFAWLYDRTTRTLFSSDFFGEVPLAAPGDRPVSDGTGITYEQVREHVFARFYWMRDADPGPLLGDLDAVFGGREIERLCPYHGCVIEGADAVRRHLSHARRVLGARAAAVKE
ncbi:MBL fold metallo-hydrolase [Actinomadura rugatobispora]|uniref:MBL fold metallo-hydrolase n=1 Tax=Actinomadura rugatobispora TaxID=1994 RepID=A0ABW1AFC0_9ACTN|nr:hypothetical protein GCM10010200_078330 [Actinomadura rugatobispora]